jgi:hypothetical protein
MYAENLWPVKSGSYARLPNWGVEQLALTVGGQSLTPRGRA